MKPIWKALCLVFLVDLVQNLLLLYFYKMPINQSVIIGVALFSLVSVLIIEKVINGKEVTNG